MATPESAVDKDIGDAGQLLDKLFPVGVRILRVHEVTKVGQKLYAAQRHTVVRADLKRVFQMRVYYFRRENGVPVTVKLAGQVGKVVADKLYVKNPVPAGVILVLVGAAQMRTDDHAAVAVCQIMYFLKGEIEEAPYPGVVSHTVVVVAGHLYRYVEVATDENGFPHQIRGA